MSAYTVQQLPRRTALGTSAVRLTRRGRALVVALTLLLALTVLTFVGARSAAVPVGTKLEPTHQVVVQPGQTLWDIAAAAAGGADLRATIEAIADLNGLAGAGDLQIGQQLAVPGRS